MERRSQKYEENNEKSTVRPTRLMKNKYLYDDINYKIGYEEIQNLDTQTKIDLSELTNPKANTREAYQKTRDFIDQSKQSIEVEKQDLPVEEKVYDINAVLEEARKNRIKYDELEKKRKLKENNYATLADVNDKQSELQKQDIDEEQLTELINTITSHTLLNDIKEAEKNSEVGNEEILADLLATNVDLNLEKGIAEEFTKNNDIAKVDESFYTKSMDLSEQDFELSEELERDKKLKTKIIIVVIVIIAILAVVAFVILKRKGII